MPGSKKSFDVSFIITAHNEGLIAHKTMLSVFRAVDYAARLKIEIIVSLDRPDDTTRDYFSRYSTDARVTVVTVDYGDLSASRNNAAKIANGNILTFLDADDLISENWITEGVTATKASKKPTIVHPEFSVTFGDDNLVWQKRDSRDITTDTLIMVDNNLWDSPSMSERATYLATPYLPNGNGYGYEDKQFHAETLAKGIRHLVAHKTALFVRRKNSGSMLRQSNSDRVTIAPTSLLEFDRMVNLPIDTANTVPQAHSQSTPQVATTKELLRLSKKLARKAHQNLKKSSHYTRMTESIRQQYLARQNAGVTQRFPGWLLDEWRQLHTIDNTLFPAKALLEWIPLYNAENTQSGMRYVELVKALETKPDTLFFVPWLIKGGADMLFINYANELARIHPHWNIAMLQTERKDSVWKDNLNEGISFTDLFKIFSGLDDETKQRLLATLIVQNDIKRIIIGNSQLAYDFASNYQTLIKRQKVAIYCYAFGEEFDDEGRLWGHIHTGIPRIYPVIHRVITDNQNTVNKLEREYAFDHKKFSVHYQPTAVKVKPPVFRTEAPLKVLWASRICKQKRPDILKAVSKQLDTSKYTIDAYGQLEEDFTERFFEDTPISYKGPFNGMQSLPVDQYDVYLYTSEGDGVPNVLQEITASGLPIIASNVGGIREFIKTGKTGMLIDDHNDIAQYVAAIDALADPKLRKKVTDGAQALLATQFSRKEWEQNIKKTFDR